MQRLTHTTPTTSADRLAALQRGEAVVANRKTDGALVAWATARGMAVYIGRPGPWGNPYVLGRDGDRDAVCQRFTDYLRGNPKLLARLPELRGKLLVCHCHPLRCHGESLIAELCNGGRH